MQLLRTDVLPQFEVYCAEAGMILRVLLQPDLEEYSEELVVSGYMDDSNDEVLRRQRSSHCIERLFPWLVQQTDSNDYIIAMAIVFLTEKLGRPSLPTSMSSQLFHFSKLHMSNATGQIFDQLYEEVIDNRVEMSSNFHLRDVSILEPDVLSSDRQLSQIAWKRWISMKDAVLLEAISLWLRHGQSDMLRSEHEAHLQWLINHPNSKITRHIFLVDRVLDINCEICHDVLANYVDQLPQTMMQDDSTMAEAWCKRQKKQLENLRIKLLTLVKGEHTINATLQWQEGQDFDKIPCEAQQHFSYFADLSTKLTESLKKLVDLALENRKLRCTKPPLHRLDEQLYKSLVREAFIFQALDSDQLCSISLEIEEFAFFRNACDIRPLLILQQTHEDVWKTRHLVHSIRKKLLAANLTQACVVRCLDDNGCKLGIDALEASLLQQLTVLCNLEKQRAYVPTREHSETIVRIFEKEIPFECSLSILLAGVDHLENFFALPWLKRIPKNIHIYIVTHCLMDNVLPHFADPRSIHVIDVSNFISQQQKTQFNMAALSFNAICLFSRDFAQWQHEPDNVSVAKQYIENVEHLFIHEYVSSLMVAICSSAEPATLNQLQTKRPAHWRHHLHLELALLLLAPFLVMLMDSCGERSFSCRCPHFAKLIFLLNEDRKLRTHMSPKCTANIVRNATALNKFFRHTDIVHIRGVLNELQEDVCRQFMQLVEEDKFLFLLDYEHFLMEHLEMDNLTEEMRQFLVLLHADLKSDRQGFKSSACDFKSVLAALGQSSFELETSQIDTLCCNFSSESNLCVAVSSQRNELVVWHLEHLRPIRVICGVDKPRDIRMVNDHLAVVLCDRELCLLDINRGCLMKRLKGVLNIKMPLFEIQDTEHVVAISRNRMYLNVTNLSSGEVELTYKVGEDRFLCSLVVSADGHYCVCGDDCEKPTPLLIWDLRKRKLLFDHRLPDHTFLFQLCDITHNGHFVACGVEEDKNPYPNFIVVYDQQNGQLFKKIKSPVSCTTLTISGHKNLVIFALEDSRICGWDLLLGQETWSTSPNCFPPNKLSLSNNEDYFVSYDIVHLSYRRTLHLWNTQSGACVSCYQASNCITACALTPDGKKVVLGLRDTVQPLVLQLRDAGNAGEFQVADEEVECEILQLKEM